MRYRSAGAQELDFMLENCEYEQKNPLIKK